MKKKDVLVTVVETKSFESDARDCMSEDETNEFISYIAADPEAGVVIQGTGGIRKVRWAIENRGKRSGVRIIYYFHNSKIPLFLLAVFKKNERVDLSSTDKRLLKSLAEELVSNYENVIEEVEK